MNVLIFFRLFIDKNHHRDEASLRPIGRLRIRCLGLVPIYLWRSCIFCCLSEIVLHFVHLICLRFNPKRGNARTSKRTSERATESTDKTKYAGHRNICCCCCFYYFYFILFILLFIYSHTRILAARTRTHTCTYIHELIHTGYRAREMWLAVATRTPCCRLYRVTNARTNECLCWCERRFSSELRSVHVERPTQLIMKINS